MTFAPTAEQLAIIDAAVTTKDNLLLSALAGASKSTTLQLIARALPTTNMLCVAFNKKIADELKEKLPGNCTSSTLNSLGHRAWGQTLGQRLVLDRDKCGDIMKALIAQLSKSEQDEAWEHFPDLMRAVGSAKAAGHVPDLLADDRKNTRLMDDAQLIESLEEKISPLERTLLLRTLEESMRQAFAGKVDFNDQLLMPTVFFAQFPIFSLILVDEAQDLSELNHQMLAKLYRRRIIAVGDQCQAIYAFRGAHESGMAELQSRFDMREMRLSISFRCPPAVVEHVRWRAPHIQAWDSHPFPGEVKTLDTWELENIPDDAAVICRNNAPLFGLAVKLLKSGRYPKLWGNDIGQSLLKVMEKLGSASTTQAVALTQLREWQTTQAKRVKNKSALQDKTDCIRVFLEAAPTLGGAIDYATTIFRASGRVNLMTGHKSKGHEFDHVFFLNEDLLRDEGQDLNLRYVICTRAKQTLTYIKSAGLMIDE